jgi:hypothetical protein
MSFASFILKEYIYAENRLPGTVWVHQEIRRWKKKKVLRWIYCAVKQHNTWAESKGTEAFHDAWGHCSSSTSISQSRWLCGSLIREGGVNVLSINPFSSFSHPFTASFYSSHDWSRRPKRTIKKTRRSRRHIAVCFQMDSPAMTADELMERTAHHIGHASKNAF